jgi:protein-S-isoprenylcysteine O-methyltransferase Ste14
MLIFLVAMVVSRYLFPGTNLLPHYWSFLGFVPIVLGLGITLAADKLFKQAQTTVHPFKESSLLITVGVYRLSRNPMYLGMTLVLLGVALLLGSLTPFIYIPIFVILINEKFIKTEEKMLEEQFGRTWLEYSLRVGRWI